METILLLEAMKDMLYFFAIGMPGRYGSIERGGKAETAGSDTHGRAGTLCAFDEDCGKNHPKSPAATRGKKEREP